MPHNESVRLGFVTDVKTTSGGDFTHQCSPASGYASVRPSVASWVLDVLWRRVALGAQHG